MKILQIILYSIVFVCSQQIFSMSVVKRLQEQRVPETSSLRVISSLLKDIENVSPMASEYNNIVENFFDLILNQNEVEARNFFLKHVASHERARQRCRALFYEFPKKQPLLIIRMREAIKVANFFELRILRELGIDVNMPVQDGKKDRTITLLLDAIYSLSINAPKSLLGQELGQIIIKYLIDINHVTLFHSLNTAATQEWHLVVLEYLLQHIIWSTEHLEKAESLALAYGNIEAVQLIGATLDTRFGKQLKRIPKSGSQGSLSDPFIPAEPEISPIAQVNEFPVSSSTNR